MGAFTAWNQMTGIKAFRIDNPAAVDGSPEAREEWLKLRRQGIGGSDIAALVGVNPFKSAIDVFLDKTGRGAVVEENEKMKWGKLLEDPVAQEYATVNNYKVQRCNAILQHTESPVCLANIDRLILKENTGYDTNGILEVKTTSYAPAWEGGCIPDMYALQLQWYLGITGLAWGQFATLVQGQNLIIPPQVSRQLWDHLRLIAERFWQDNVLKNVPPKPEMSTVAKEAMARLYPNVITETVTLSKETCELAHQRAELRAIVKKAEEGMAGIDAQVLAEMKEAKSAVGTGFKVTRVCYDKAGVNMDKLKAEYPEVVSACFKSSRVTYPLFTFEKGAK